MIKNIKELKGIHSDEDIYILANAPSIRNFNLGDLKGKVSIGMNANPLLEKEFGFVSDYYVVSDMRFMNHPDKRDMAINQLNPRTKRVFKSIIKDVDDNNKNDTYYIKTIAKDGYSFNLKKGYYFGSTTTMLAIQLASYLGAKNIYILGMDLTYSGKTPRFYEEDTVQEFDQFTSVQIRNVRNAYKRLKESGVNLYNCSKDSLLYPYLPYKSVLSVEGSTVGLVSKGSLTTEQIIRSVSVEIGPIMGNKERKYEQWISDYRGYEHVVMEMYSEDVQNNFPLNEDVMKMVYKSIFGIQPFSKNFILNNYEKNQLGIDYLVYPAKSPKKMVILFSGLSGHKTYNRFSWYWDEKENWDGDTVYLFLNDITETWYCGSEENPKKKKYIEIIDSVMDEYGVTKKNTYAVGGSMGGYASILFAVKMDLAGIISIHPQTNSQDVELHHDKSWRNNIKKAGREFEDLPKLLKDSKSRPLLYIEYGEYPADKGAVVKLLREYRKQPSMIIERNTENDGHVTENPSKDTVESVIRLFRETGLSDGFIGDIGVNK